MRIGHPPLTPTIVVSAAALAVAAAASPSAAADWISAPSYYSHDPATGQRLRQYTPVGPFYTYPRGDFRRSGYRQTRSSIQVGASSDHMHIVEEWGRPVRPYGEWRFPYRPYSVPYDLWGAPVPEVFAPTRINAGRGGRQGRPNPAGPAGGSPAAGDAAANSAAGASGAGTGPAGDSAFPPQFRNGPVSQPYPGYFPQPWHDGRYPPYDADGPYGYPDLLQRPSLRSL